MKVANYFPPNIEEIKKAFEIRPSTVYTYGDTLYNPGGGYISKELMLHEERHQKQQGDDPAAWWEKYLADPQFRFEQELAAYRVQYRAYLKHNSREDAFRFLCRIAKDLSSSMYGSIVDFDKALKMIKS